MPDKFQNFSQCHSMCLTSCPPPHFLHFVFILLQKITPEHVRTFILGLKYTPVY